MDQVFPLFEAAELGDLKEIRLHIVLELIFSDIGTEFFRIGDLLQAGTSMGLERAFLHYMEKNQVLQCVKA